MTPEDAALLVVIVAVAVVLVRVLPWIALGLVALLGLSWIVAVSYALKAYERARGWPLLGGAALEADTERDGFLSYSGEVHAVGIGLAIGVLAWLTSPWVAVAWVVVIVLRIRRDSPLVAEAAREGWYNVAAVLAGYGLVDVLAGVAF